MGIYFFVWGKIQEFFKDKDISDPKLIQSFLEENEVKKFGDFRFPERTLQVSHMSFIGKLKVTFLRVISIFLHLLIGVSQKSFGIADVEFFLLWRDAFYANPIQELEGF